MYSEKITPEIIHKIVQHEDTGNLYKIGAGSRIVMARKCAYCGSDYYPRKKSQKYCSNSCRVMACYERNRYKYKSGRYEKVASTDLTKEQPNLAELISIESIKPKEFDWQNFKESALANASVETAKYLMHDRPLMNKIDKLLEMVGGSNLQHNLKYMGIQENNGKPISLFQGSIIINDVAGRWYKMISRNPVNWKVVDSPFK